MHHGTFLHDLYRPVTWRLGILTSRVIVDLVQHKICCIPALAVVNAAGMHGGHSWRTEDLRHGLRIHTFFHSISWSLLLMGIRNSEPVTKKHIVRISRPVAVSSAYCALDIKGKEAKHTIPIARPVLRESPRNQSAILSRAIVEHEYHSHDLHPHSNKSSFTNISSSSSPVTSLISPSAQRRAASST